MIPVVPGSTAILHLDSQVGVTTSGGFVDSWADQSGFGNNVTSTGTQRPTVIAGAGVGLTVPALDFDGVDDRLINTAMNTAGGDTTYTNITVFIVAAPASNAGGFRAFLSGTNSADFNDFNTGLTIDLSGGSSAAFNVVNFEGRQSFSGALDMVPTDSYAFNTPHILTLDSNAANSDAFIFLDGTTQGSRPLPSSAFTADITKLRIGARFYLGIERGYLDGAFAKVVVFEGNLNTAQRIIVENNLSASTGSPLLANNVYAGDTGAKGNYIRDVIGIGRVDSTNTLTDTTSISGLRIQENSGTLSDGEFLLAGHKVDVNSIISSGTGNRWDRVWYLDKSDGASIDASLEFDFSDAGLVSTFNPLTQVARLMYSSTDPLSFSQLPLTASVTGDAFKFDVPNSLLLDGYYTLEIQSVPEPSSFIIMAFAALLVFPIRRWKKIDFVSHD